MSITINGTGTITGLSVGGLPDGCISTDDIAAGAVTDAKVNASAAIADSKLSGTTCKAWVNFNGTSTVAIRASYNVSSIMDNGVGNYTVNFTTAMADTQFSAVATGTQDGFATSTNSNVGLSGFSTSSVGFLCRNNADTAYVDYATVCVAIFR